MEDGGWRFSIFHLRSSVRESARGFFVRLASEVFLSSLQSEFFSNLLVSRRGKASPQRRDFSIRC
jgi:hypothetical protein